MATTTARRLTITLGVVLALSVACGDASGQGSDVPTGNDDAPVGSTEPAGADEPSDRDEPVDTGPDDEAPSLTLVPDPASGDGLPTDDAPPTPATTILDVAYGEHPDQLLDLHLPAEPRAPVVLYLHSGGWGSDTRTIIPEMVMRFVERGYAVVPVAFRLSPEHTFPAAVEDVKRAVRWLKTAPMVDGLVDGDRIVAYGASSGGLLAGLVATTPGSFEPTGLTPAEAGVDSSVAGLVSVVGPTDLVALFEDPHPWAAGAIESFLGCSPCDAGRLTEASPTTHLQSGIPPAYWAYGALDPIVEATSQGAMMAAAWGNVAGADNSWFDLVEGAAHNLDHTTINQRFVEQFVDRAVALN